MIDVLVRDLVMAYEVDKNILDGLSFEVQAGERVGILGRNGTGKTTLFKLLTGELTEDSGIISIAPSKKLGLISQIPVYPDHYSVEDVLRCAFDELEHIRHKMESLAAQMTENPPKQLLNEYDSLANRYTVGGGYEMDLNVEKICNGLSIPKAMREQPFYELSGGEKTRINLARLLLEDTDILLLDEPTNHLDLKSTEWLEEYLLSFKGTVLTISHDRYFLDRVVQRIIEIRDGKAEFYSGNYSFYVEEKQARFELQLKKYEQEQAKAAQLNYTIERMKGWGTNNRAMYRRAMAMEHRMERILQTERPTQDKQVRARFSAREFHADEVMVTRDLSMRFGERTLFSDVNLLMQGGDRIALMGDNGSGKSTFIKILMQELAPTSGRVKFGPSVRYAYLPQIIHFSQPYRSLLDTMVYEKNMSTQSARNRLGSFLFSGPDVFKLVGQLSGGEQMRLRLCMLMDEQINLLILDEPTNHLDISSREWIEAAIADYDGALLFVSHDRYFVNQFANRIWTLENNQITDFKGDYQQYRAMLERRSVALPTNTAQKSPKREKRQNPKNTRDLEKQLNRLEREIAQQEAAISELDNQIEASATDYEALTKLLSDKEAAEQVLDEMMTQWESLGLQIEEGNAAKAD